jgi:Protein of unknown function (DUF3604)
MSLPSTNAYRAYHNWVGDLHNHCAIGYGHGTVEEAWQNARLQLDFAAVTPHAVWPDLPAGEPRLSSVVDYHRRGFRRTTEEWSHLCRTVQANHEPGKFVTFLGFEWHSMRYGDHHVLFQGDQGEVIPAGDLQEMRQALRALADRGIEAMLIPHHIGYRQGYRGINWSTFDPEFSPVVEIMSMHGAAESDESPYPYLHTMGPRDSASTFRAGLALGKIAGVVGSTDHHSAHPGSYGHGRVAVWASSLTRAGIWEALVHRRTYALTGDRIGLAFSLDDQPMGSVLGSMPERRIVVSVEGGDELDTIDLVHNNRVIRRWDTPGHEPSWTDEPCKVYFEVGWGERGETVDWQVSLEVHDGQLLDVEPRFRGHEIVAPQATEEEKYAFSHWERPGENRVELLTRTWGNPTTTTSSTQGVCLELRGSPTTVLEARINGRSEQVNLTDLFENSRAGYLGGFLTPAYLFHRAVPYSKYHCEFEWTHQTQSLKRDWYYVRVRQRNNQCAWSSPIWVAAQ